MRKSLRLSEKWFRRGLWVVALVFANFLIGLGSTIVGDLPKVQATFKVEDFLVASGLALQEQIHSYEQERIKLQEQLAQNQLEHSRTRATTQTAEQGLRNWSDTRSVTQRSDQDPEVLRRTHEVDE